MPTGTAQNQPLADVWLTAHRHLCAQRWPFLDRLGQPSYEWMGSAGRWRATFDGSI